MLYWTEDTLYWIAKPTVHAEVVNDSRRLHCVDGPALEADSENLYFWHGVLVPAFVVVRPDWITMQHIAGEQNVEVRRVMLERFGAERYLREIGAQAVHQDQCGTLYRANLAGDEALVMIEVVNSTPEHDGTWKKYMLRVDPRCSTAREAVAWTFGLTADQYQPLVET